MTLIKDAPTVWKLLNGIVCVYKPAGISSASVRKVLLGNICRDLCNLECRPTSQYVHIEGNPATSLTVHVSPNYADHPLVVGPKYQRDDIRCTWGSPLGQNVSGVFVLGLNNGNGTIKRLHLQKPTRVFRLKGLLGQATNTYFITGKVVEKATYNHVSRTKLDGLLASMQVAHQKEMFKQCGVDIQSQTAYDLAVQGLIKPSNSETPIFYGIKCVHFHPPEFTLEVQCINEHEMYLRTMVHDVGMKLRSVATCLAIQCIRYDAFTLEHALLRKHWTLQYLLDNMEENKKMLEKTEVETRKTLPKLIEYDISKLKPSPETDDTIATAY